MSDDLVERARTAAEKVYGTQFFNIEIEAAIAVVLEEAAKVALEQRCERGTPWDNACLDIAAAIRAMSEGG